MDAVASHRVRLLQLQARLARTLVDVVTVHADDAKRFMKEVKHVLQNMDAVASHRVRLLILHHRLARTLVDVVTVHVDDAKRFMKEVKHVLQNMDALQLKTKIQQRKMIKLMAHAQKESKEHVNQLKPGDVLMGTLNLIIAQTMQVMIYNVVL